MLVAVSILLGKETLGNFGTALTFLDLETTFPTSKVLLGVSNGSKFHLEIIRSLTIIYHRIGKLIISLKLDKIRVRRGVALG